MTHIFRLLEMEGEIDLDAPLDYVELQIFPCQNRYDSYVCSSNIAVKAASGTLKQLLLHSPRVKDLSSKGSNTNFKILPPDSVSDAEWFTTATLRRFIHILGSPNIISIGNEITQLEETRKFQVSLSMKAVVDIRSSIDSKNELLRAVDLRLTALKDEVVAAFDQVTRARCSTKDISDLENFAHHFGAKDIRDLLQKFVEMGLFPTVEDSKKSITNCVSPKVAQIEGHNSTENDNSSLSSEEDQPYVNRRRSATRSATPRRSASPMRRIQIGRSGSHRAPALTIKNLNHFPAREKLSFQRDPVGNSSDEDGNDPDKPAMKNVLRMSVQDKISLFESKQRDQQVDIPKTKKLLTVGPNKAVLRRWSSGMGENTIQNPENSSPEPNPKPEPNLEPKPNPNPQHESAENIKPQSPEREESCEKHPDSIEWNQQNEEKLNELLMKMMEDKNKPVQRRNPNSDVTKSKRSTVLKEVRGGYYDQHKQNRDEKLQVSGKKTQKNSNPLMNSRKEALNKPSVLKKTASKPSSLPATRKSWSSSPSPRTPTGPTSASTTPTGQKPLGSSTNTEKSLPRSKTLKSTSPNATRHLKNINQNTQPTVTKRTKTAKTKVDQTPEVKPSFYNKVTKKSSVVPLETKPFLRKRSRIGPGVGPGVVKSKVVDQPEETSRTLIHTEDNEAVMAIYMSETEEKCEPQVISPGPGPTKCEESVMISPTAWVEEVEDELDNNHEETCEPQVVSLSPGPKKCEEPVMISPIAWVEDVEDESDNNYKETCEPHVISLSPGPGPGQSRSPGPTKCEESVMISPTAWVEEVEDESDNNLKETCETQVVSLSLSPSSGPGPTKCEESVMISPSAWVEEVEDASDDNHEEDAIPCLLQSESPVKVFASAGTSSTPHVSQSLSQMLLEESNEEAHVSEWGNAEHQPALVYQKDSTKGFKRLLKFARKTKAVSASLEVDNEVGESKVTSQNHSKVTEGHVSASTNSTKGTRSFFSLSAFRVSKTNESKLL